MPDDKKRLTVSITDETLKSIKHLAIEQEITISEIVEDLLKDYIHKNSLDKV